jgi:hypothetical protein
MKLNPPASSSDLETARAAARRLHQRAFASESNPSVPEPSPPVPARREPWEIPPPARDPLPLHPPGAPPAGAPGPARRASPPVQREPRPAPEPEPELELEPPGDSSEPELDIDPSPPGVYSEKPESWNEVPSEPQGSPWDADPAGSGTEPEDALAELTGETDESPDGISPEDLVSEPAPPEPEWSESPPFEVDTDTGPATPTESLVEVAGPSWDEVADTCLGLAHARGAMLVDAAGQVLAARGDWPNPGPEAIAGRLVHMMERALRDAPTRSVSAPLAGQHLTAWRVPVGGALLTAVFMGDAPLRADVRPAIDQEIGRSAGV